MGREKLYSAAQMYMPLAASSWHDFWISRAVSPRLEKRIWSSSVVSGCGV